VIVGLQRIVRTAAAMTEVKQIWQELIAAEVSHAYPDRSDGQTRYKLLVSKSSGGALLCVFLRRDIAETGDEGIANARVAWYGGGILDSRGTLAFRCEWSGSSLCFMASFFEGKAGECSDTLRNLRFGLTGGDRSDRKTLSDLEGRGAVGTGDAALDHDLLVWFGDFHASLRMEPAALRAAVGGLRVADTDGKAEILLEDPADVENWCA